MRSTTEAWNWKAREHATGLIHAMKSTNKSAATWCERHIVVTWSHWTEMPITATVSCIRCLVGKPGPRLP